MWSGAFTHVLIAITIILMISLTLKINHMSTTNANAIGASSATAARTEEMVTEKLRSVQLLMEKERSLSLTLQDRTDALIAAERRLAQYEILELLHLPVDQDKMQDAKEITQRIRTGLPSSKPASDTTTTTYQEQDFLFRAT